MENALLTSLVNIISIEEEKEESFIARFYLDPSNQIFEGHFPEQAVLPGVIMVNIVKRCLEQIENRPMQMQSAGNIKFLSLLVPNKEVYLMKFTLKKEEELLKVNAQLIQEDTIYFKQNASYKARK